MSFATKSGLGGRRFCREEEAVFGRAYRRHFETGGARFSGGRVVWQHGISEQSFYRCKKIYGIMEPSEAKELRQLRDENAKLKRIVADLSLDKAMLQDVLQKKF